MIGKKRLVEFDFLRVLAILLIVVIHTIDFAGLWRGTVISAYLGVLGVGTFFLMSGFLISRSSPRIENKIDCIAFLKKRFLRIYPLYWIALIVILLMYPEKYDFLSISVNLLGLQGVFSPLPNILDMSLWFVGVIVLFYISYIILTYLSGDSNKRFIFIAIFMVICLGMLRYFVGIVDGKYFEYYFVFIFGALLQRSNFIDENRLRVIRCVEIVGFSACWVFILFADSMMPNDVSGITPSIFIQAGIIAVVRIVLVICSSLLLIDIARSLSISPRITKLLQGGALASYAVYLFHLQFVEIFNEYAFILLGKHTPLYILSIIFLFIPLLFIFAYYAQMTQDRLFRMLEKRGNHIEVRK